MIKIEGIYNIIISKENLYRAAYMASRGRRYRDTVADFNFCLEDEIERLHRELASKTYRHGRYRVFRVYDPKQRSIAAAPFRDRVVHHAVHDVIEPLIDKTFIYDSYACRKAKGTHMAVDRAQGFLRANAFCFHGDIKKYFPSINHNILKGILRRRIDDGDLLWLLDEVIDSANQVSGQAGRGLPIGNLTSQFFANLYLNELDYFVKFDLRLKYYVRYMDDFLVFSNDKIMPIRVKEELRDFLKNRLALDMHGSKSRIYMTGRGIKFLGFRIFKDYRRLASDNVRRFKNRLKKFEYLSENGKMDKHKIQESVRCWAAHSNYANTENLRLSIWDNIMARNTEFGNLLKGILLEGLKHNSNLSGAKDELAKVN